MTLERQDGVPTLERGNDQGRAVERFFGPGEPAACRMHFAGMARSYYTTSQPGVKGGSGPYRDMRGNYPKQPFGAEPGGGVWNQEQGASCLSAASSCPAGSAPRRPGSSQRQGCPFAVVWRRPHDGFFSLGRQRKERRPARGRGHPGDAGASTRRSHAGAWERSTLSRAWPAPTRERSLGA